MKFISEKLFEKVQFLLVSPGLILILPYRGLFDFGASEDVYVLVELETGHEGWSFCYEYSESVFKKVANVNKISNKPGYVILILWKKKKKNEFKPTKKRQMKKHNEKKP